MSSLLHRSVAVAEVHAAPCARCPAKTQQQLQLRPQPTLDFVFVSSFVRDERESKNGHSIARTATLDSATAAASSSVTAQDTKRLGCCDGAKVDDAVSV